MHDKDIARALIACDGIAKDAVWMLVREAAALQGGYNVHRSVDLTSAAKTIARAQIDRDNEAEADVLADIAVIDPLAA